MRLPRALPERIVPRPRPQRHALVFFALVLVHVIRRRTVASRRRRARLARRPKPPRLEPLRGADRVDAPPDEPTGARAANPSCIGRLRRRLAARRRRVARHRRPARHVRDVAVRRRRRGRRRARRAHHRVARARVPRASRASRARASEDVVARVRARGARRSIEYGTWVDVPSLYVH